MKIFNLKILISFVALTLSTGMSNDTNTYNNEIQCISNQEILHEESYNQLKDIEENIRTRKIKESKELLNNVNDYDNNWYINKKEEIKNKINQEEKRRKGILNKKRKTYEDKINNLNIPKKNKEKYIKEINKKKSKKDFNNIIKKAKEKEKQIKEEKLKRKLKKQERERKKKEQKRKEEEKRAYEERISRPNTITVKGHSFDISIDYQERIDMNYNEIVIDDQGLDNYSWGTNKTHSDGTSWFGALHDYNGGNLFWDATEILYSDINGNVKTYYLEYTSPLTQYTPKVQDTYHSDLIEGYVPNRIAIKTCQGYNNSSYRYYVFREEGQPLKVSYTKEY